MSSDTDVACQIVNLFSSEKCFIYFISDVLMITCNEFRTTLRIQFWYKGRYTRYMGRNDMFILWNCISAIFYMDKTAVYTSWQNSALLFINGLIFGIRKTQNNQSLEFA